jgi:Mn-dependent DtxR family transcriptional regulator
VPAGINTSEVSGRFQYHYVNSDKLVEGIKKFKEIVDFCTHNKPIKKQKRTDSRDEDRYRR